MNDELKERVKALAVEAGGVPVSDDDPQCFCGNMAFTDNELTAFAQAVAHDCAVEAFRTHHLIADAGTTQYEIVKAIRARYGLGD